MFNYKWAEAKRLENAAHHSSSKIQLRSEIEVEMDGFQFSSIRREAEKRT